MSISLTHLHAPTKKKKKNTKKYNTTYPVVMNFIKQEHASFFIIGMYLFCLLMHDNSKMVLKKVVTLFDQ